MNWQHLSAFLWLRRRLAVNQKSRAGTGAIVLQTIIRTCGVILALGGFTGALFAGLATFPSIPIPVFMLVWDGVVLAFLFFWMIGMLAELQRSELLSMEKFLHLPVSLSGVFIINYAAALLTPSVVLFVPAMIGFSIGVVSSKGPQMLWLFPLVAAFVLMLTALTYQFRGWLAALMVNQRRRRTIVAFATMFFVIVMQLPNLAINVMPKRFRPAGQTNLQQIESIAATANMAVPLGWLPYGARAAAEGRFLPAALCALGMTLIGAASLRRSYATTMRLYSGEFSSGKPRSASPKTIERDAPAARSAAPLSSLASPPSLLERQLPRISEQASAIALACFRSLTRAPEAKMILLSPIFMVIVFGSMTLKLSNSPSPFARPLMASGAIVMILFSMMQLAGNQFGFDRSGFRNFVLASASRKDILLGKNLSLAPLALGMGTVVIVLLQLVFPMRFDHFIAVLAQMVSMYLVFCLVANVLSIVAPTPIASGSLRPVKPKGMTILIHLAFFFLFPLTLAPTLIPLGLEFILTWSGWFTGFPVYLPFSIAELIVVATLYPLALSRQGAMLQSREQRILEIVTASVE